MKESPAKVKENRASARQMRRILVLAIALELLRPAVHLRMAGSHDAGPRAIHAALDLRSPEVAPRPIKLIEPLPAAMPNLALLL